ncbi:hypothetical protein FACS1894178_4020 [Bacteroidia bacterium]|nr:hypothetical protein FACS1894178_4020 [Bacteroidia bacterium]
MDTSDYVKDITPKIKDYWIEFYRIQMFYNPKKYFENGDISYLDFLKDSILIEEKAIAKGNEMYNKFYKKMPDNIVFVLNLVLDSNNKLEVDTHNLCFHLFDIQKNIVPEFYASVENGSVEYYCIYSFSWGKNVKKSYNKIFRKKPEYWLFCDDIGGLFNILYLKENQIYVYDICDKKNYKLEEYMKDIYPLTFGKLRDK